MPRHYIEFIDRIYILHLRNIIKRVEGNAGLILEQMPKKKPYETLMAEFFCRQIGGFSLKDSSILLFLNNCAKPHNSLFCLYGYFFSVFCGRRRDSGF